MIWAWLPLAVVLVMGFSAIVVCIARAREEAARFRRSVGELERLRPAATEAGTQAGRLRHSARRLGRHPRG